MPNEKLEIMMYLLQRTQSITQSVQSCWLDVYNNIIKSPKLILCVLCETFVPLAVKTKKTNFL
jgi:hypothetical protein